MDKGYLVELDIQMEEIKETLQRIENAKEEIYQAYRKLQEIPVIHIVAGDSHESRRQSE